ncbi:MAG: C10 family peptidase [Alistipes sp.]|nr:C10 family peptidase [Alistipes sp.]
MRKLLCFVMAAIMFVACGKDDFGLNSQPEPQNPYAVTPEEAVQMLQSVIGGETTRSISVSDIQTLNKSAFVPSTRSGADEEAIYIVDIEGKGSAIMSADKRMEPIYAILDDTKISAEQLVGVTTRSATDDESNPEDYILGLLNSAIQRDIEEVGLMAPEMPLVPRDKVWSVTSITARQEPFLKTVWHQKAPYNDNYRVDNLNRKYPAGCGPIALAQILYYNRFPNSIDGIAIDWDLLEECEKENYPPSDSAEIEVANFVHQIVLNIDDVKYTILDNGSLATGITVSNARNFLRDIGYSNTSVENYSLNSVMNMVVNNRPVYVRGDDSNNGGHAWVIDGCNVYRIEHWVRRYLDAQRYYDFIEHTSSYYLVHCNFGWGDCSCNGDYTSEIFNPNHGGVQYDYDLDLKLISYSSIY